MKKIDPIILIGGILTIISVFLPMLEIQGISATMMESGGVAYFFIVLAVLSILLSMLNKKWVYVICILFGLIIVLLAFNYISDANDSAATKGMGLYALLIGGIGILIGSVIKLFKKKIPESVS